jgi:hypothetical protein
MVLTFAEQDSANFAFASESILGLVGLSPELYYELLMTLVQ